MALLAGRLRQTIGLATGTLAPSSYFLYAIALTFATHPFHPSQLESGGV